MRYRKCVIIFASVIAAAVCGVSYGNDGCTSSKEALAVANAIVAKRWPEELKPPYPSLTTKDAKDLWMVIYDIPDGWTGGADFFIDKKTCRVVQIISGQ